MARQNGSLAVHSNFTYRCRRSLQICIFPREVLEGYIIDFPLIRRFFYSISFTTITWLLAAKLWWRKEPCFHKCEKGEENIKMASAMLYLINNIQRVQQLFDPTRIKYIFELKPVTYLSVVTAIRWHTIDAEMKRDISSSARQTADWRIILHVINIGTATRPVSRSEPARLSSSRLVIDRRCFFFAINSKTKPLKIKISIARTIAGISAAGSKYWCISPLNPSSAIWIFIKTGLLDNGIREFSLA